MSQKASVVMASFLGEYEGCASNREEKFIRAVNSFLDNDYPFKELIVVSDGCSITESILNDTFREQLLSGEIKLVKQKKEKLFSGKTRTSGIQMATGHIIMYLDTDDMLGDKHISSVMRQMIANDLDWCYYNDWINTDQGLISKSVELEYGSIGTSSIAHKVHPKINWKKCDGYGHDFKFVQKLMKLSDNYERIYGTTYIICHIPNQIDQ